MTPPHPDASSRHTRKIRPPPAPNRDAHRRGDRPARNHQDPRRLPQDGAVRHVLVVEDDPMFAKLLTRFLQGFDEQTYRSTVTGSLSEAVRHLKADSYDVILADLGLPDSREYDTIDTLTRAAPGVPIVVLTGTAEDGVGSSLEAVRRGASYFLRKGNLDAAAVERGIHYATQRKNLRDLLDDPGQGAMSG